MQSSGLRGGLYELTILCHVTVPANRIGHTSHGGPFSAPVLKMIAEFLSLTAFGVFSVRSSQTSIEPLILWLAQANLCMPPRRPWF